MKKTLQKGFSLVELLVVVAIIGVLAGVGIVGYQSYTDSAKSRVALANYNSVKRFVDTELTLLNNNIQTVSGALSEGASCSALTKYTIHSANMSEFLTGLACYFDTAGYGNAFKNPYDAAGGNQIYYSAEATEQTKGAINLQLPTNGQVVGGTTAPSAGDEAADTKGMFYIAYYTESASTAGSGDYKSSMYELK